jgi:hypothetical protein
MTLEEDGFSPLNLNSNSKEEDALNLKEGDADSIKQNN